MRTRKATGVVSAVPAIAAVLVLGHGPIASANPVEPSGVASAPAPTSAPADSAARRQPRVLCWTKRSRASGRLAARQRPRRCGLVRRRHSSRPAARLVKLRWTRWAATRGRATGVGAGGKTRTRFRVVLRRPVRGCGGLVFSRVVLHNRRRNRRFALHTQCALGGGRQDGPGEEQPGADDEPTGAESCLEASEDSAGDEEGGGPTLSPALFATPFTLSASLDGIDDDGTLPLQIEAVCGVPADLASEATTLVQLSGVALLSAATEIWTCAGSAEDEGGDSETAEGCSDIPARGGTLLQGEEALTTLANDADTAFVGVQLVPSAGWRQDEDGEPVPTFNTSWIKITD